MSGSKNHVVGGHRFWDFGMGSCEDAVRPADSAHDGRVGHGALFGVSDEEARSSAESYDLIFNSIFLLSTKYRPSLSMSCLNLAAFLVQVCIFCS